MGSTESILILGRIRIPLVVDYTVCISVLLKMATMFVDRDPLLIDDGDGGEVDVDVCDDEEGRDPVDGNNEEKKSNNDNDCSNGSEEELDTQLLFASLKSNEQASRVPYEVPINLKNAAVTCWRPDLQLVEIIKQRGNFWKTYGFSANSKLYLHPEEALLLLERGTIVIEDSNGNRIPFASLYLEIMQLTGWPCYGAFVKLKVGAFKLDRMAF
jgi:hypothetical protein